MAKYISARQLSEALGLKHIEVIRRIRKGQINAGKLDYFYIIPLTEVERIKQEEWYKKKMARLKREATAAASA